MRLAYLFPTFPVFPGVLMLQALTEAATWLVYETRAFAPEVILLRRARNVTYKSFVKPGDSLTLTVACRRLSQGESEFDGVGRCKDNAEEVVKARFDLVHLPPDPRRGFSTHAGRRLAKAARARFAILRQ